MFAAFAGSEKRGCLCWAYFWISIRRAPSPSWGITSHDVKFYALVIAFLSLRVYSRSAVIGSRLFGFKRNVSIFCGARECISHHLTTSPETVTFSQWCFSRLFFHKSSCISVCGTSLVLTWITFIFHSTRLSRIRHWLSYVLRKHACGWHNKTTPNFCRTRRKTTNPSLNLIWYSSTTPYFMYGRYVRDQR